METQIKPEYKTLLDRKEFLNFTNSFKQSHYDYQTNHYFDTSRFSLKATDASLRVRERDNLELILKRKKGYTVSEFKLRITEEDFEIFKKSGVIPDSTFQQEVINLINNQKLINFLSLTTKRAVFSLPSGLVFLDENIYLGTTDYELIFESKNYNDSKKEFIMILKENGITYKKAEKKIKRAYNALKFMD